MATALATPFYIDLGYDLATIGIIAKNVGTVKGEFMLYRIEKGHIPQLLQDLFIPPSAIPSPRHPFETQYDTYLMRYEDIVE